MIAILFRHGASCQSLFIWFYLLGSLHAPPSVKALCCTVGLYTALERERESRGLQEKGRGLTFEPVAYSSRVDSSLFQLRQTELEGKTGTFSFCLVFWIKFLCKVSCVSRFETSLAVSSQWYLINCFCVSISEWTTPFSFSDILNVTTPRSSALHAENGRTVPVLHSTSYPHQRPRSSLRQRSRKGTFHTLSCCVCVCVCVGFLKHLRWTCCW